jgi:hypothetical protein
VLKRNLFFVVVLSLFLYFDCACPVYAQETIIKGKVTDAETGEALPFVNVFYKGTVSGVSTDFDGYYQIRSAAPNDSLVASYIGYLPKTKHVKKGESQTINFQLSADVVTLGEVVVFAGENPAFPVIRKVIQEKSKNDYRSLAAYECESYSKIQIDIDNISENFRKKKVMKKIVEVFDNIDRIAGEDGKPILPVYVSEAISKIYYRNDPFLKREEVQKTKITGIGLDENSVLAQFIGSTDKDINFYESWVPILGKSFVSPVADVWKLYYDYSLVDSLFLGEEWCYQIEVSPKRAQDLAFSGTLWVNATTYAIRQLDFTIPKEANLNYIEKVKIKQELQPTLEGPSVVTKTRLLIDIAEMNNSSAGMLAKIYVSNKDFQITQPKENEFYKEHYIRDEDAINQETGYWESHRHDSLTEDEKKVYAIIDTIKKVPVVKSYIEVANIAINGYKKLGPVDLGPYMGVYAFNNIEGHRFSTGFRTNYDFSSKWIIKGYGAYGILDKRFKYGAEITHIISRKPWAIAGAKRSDDLEQVALLDNSAQSNQLFAAFTRFGNYNRRRPFRNIENNLFVQVDIIKGLTQKITFSNRSFDPLYNFLYYSNPDAGDSETFSKFTTSEVVFETRYAKDEQYYLNKNERVRFEDGKWPVITFRYIKGIKNLFDSDFSYHKFNLSLRQKAKLGILGYSTIVADGGYIPSRLPYPLLKSHLGNESPFYNMSAFNMMNYFEFVSDTYGSISYFHNFEGFLLNNIPLISRLKWRLVATGNLLYGSVRKENIAIIPAFDEQGQPGKAFTALRGKPYAEVSYGVENIFKVLRVDVVHRLTYLDNPEAKNIGVRFSLHFKL